MIKTENLIISQAVSKQNISILTDDGIYILKPEELELYIFNCIKNGKAEKFD